MTQNQPPRPQDPVWQGPQNQTQTQGYQANSGHFSPVNMPTQPTMATSQDSGKKVSFSGPLPYVPRDVNMIGQHFESRAEADTDQNPFGRIDYHQEESYEPGDCLIPRT